MSDMTMVLVSRRSTSAGRIFRLKLPTPQRGDASFHHQQDDGGGVNDQRIDEQLKNFLPQTTNPLWFTLTDTFDTDFGVDEWHGTNVFYRDGDRAFRTYFVNNRGDEQMGSTWNYLDITPLGRQEVWEDSPEGYPQSPPYKWWNWHDKLRRWRSTGQEVGRGVGCGRGGIPEQEGRVSTAEIDIHAVDPSQGGRLALGAARQCCAAGGDHITEAG
jgi:Bacterial protein of unknown function (DUF899)